ncbi:MAG: ATPase, T2SS/T4P/T4SS family [Acidobacteriota bacterium]|nr:ATPase, T2SS/T4P/T4SS family [Acidobacteriota bacterium]
MLETIMRGLTEKDQELYRLLAPMIQPILAPLADPAVSEIFIYRPERIVCRVRGVDRELPGRFKVETLRRLIQQLGTFNGRRIGFGKGHTPILEGTLPCGSRVSGVLKGVNADADALTIRKHTHAMLSPQDLIDLGSITPEALAWLRRAIEADQSILISGATDSGKTTFLNVLAQCLPDEHRILVCEDTPELQIDKPNVVRFRTDPHSGIGFLELLDPVHAAIGRPHHLR